MGVNLSAYQNHFDILEVELHHRLKPVFLWRDFSYIVNYFNRSCIGRILSCVALVSINLRGSYFKISCSKDIISQINYYSGSMFKFRLSYLGLEDLTVIRIFKEEHHRLITNLNLNYLSILHYFISSLHLVSQLLIDLD